MCVCVRACVRGCVRACVRACVRVCVCVCCSSFCFLCFIGEVLAYCTVVFGSVTAVKRSLSYAFL